MAVAAGPNGVAIGCACWVNPDTGEASNVQSEGTILGFVLPHANPYNLWERVYTQFPVDGVPPFRIRVIRPGVRCVIVMGGVFSPQFAQGGEAGRQVFTDPATGLLYSGPNPPGAPFFGTPWVLLSSGGPGARIRMSSYVLPFNVVRDDSGGIIRDSRGGILVNQ